MVGSEGYELVRSSYTIYQVRMPIDPAYFPASRAESLTRTAHSDGALEHTWQRCNRDMFSRIEGQMLIDFVRDDGHIVLYTQFSDERQLLLSKDTTGGIMWSI